MKMDKGKDLLKEYIENAENTLRLLITKKCNSKCIYCYEEGIFGSTNKQPQLLDINDFKKIILAGKGLGIKRISIAGGEPTLYFPWVEEIVKLCRKENLLVYLTTNATNEKIISLAKKYPKLEFRISLDCSSREKYKYFRGIDLFDQIIKIIKELAGYSNEIHINRVITSLDNEWQEFNEMINLFKKEKLDKKNVYLRLIPCYPNKYSKDLSVINYIRFLAEHIPRLKTQLSERNLQFMYAFKYKNVNILIRTRGIYSPKCCPNRCAEGIAYTRINPDGAIQPCFGIFLDKIKHNDDISVIKRKLENSRKFLDELYVKDYNIKKEMMI